MITFSNIDGTPVYYWRSNRPNTTPRNWQCTQEFYDRLVLWIRDLRSLASAYGSITYVVSAGFYVNKPGEHGAGTAADIDHIQWSSGTVCTPLDRHHASTNIALRRRYLGLDAVTRRRFRYVLDGWYNADHADHIHADFGGLPIRLLTGSQSDTKFIQAACNNFRNAGLTVDGDWGPLTQSAYNSMKSALGVSGDPTAGAAAYQQLLSGIAQHGFANTPI
ncbi:hypothetical protein DMH04_01315 [Kibdelosporangium aridum]|uniref:Extensin-like protein C-terminus n=1 Tax=Kibdelosporangium aridum TaxID=2030 RepID=A0A428ZU85_KIBAR|nr:hypothetical protein [Kibdelosporangium aridum]RSM91646.1 hypothetical protein DMH04_01315 [Kibdelosporangium aridum]